MLRALVCLPIASHTDDVGIRRPRRLSPSSFLLVPAYLGSSGQKAVKRLCVCVCVCVNWLQLRRDELLVCAYRRMTRKRADCRSSCRSLTAALATFPSLRRASSTSSLTTCTRLGLVSRILVYKQQQLLVVYTTTPV